MRGVNNKFLGLIATNLLDILPDLPKLLPQLSAIMAGEVYSDKSKRPDFNYLAWHCSVYNRYTEKVRLSLFCIFS